MSTRRFMSTRQRLIGVCDAMLVAAIGALQIAMLIAIANSAGARHTQAARLGQVETANHLQVGG
jgi:hypothetical protein